MKQFESFRLDTSNECLWQDSVQINLPPKPFAVLRYLVENPGRLISHDELLDALWPETYVQPQVLRTYMLDLRKILGDDPGCPRFIQTLPKRGYCFVAQVKDAGAPDSAAAATSEPQAAISDGVVGREQELARLKTLARELAYGHRQTVFVTGPTGIGKTALVEAACHQMVAILSASMAWGQCVDGLGKKEDCYAVMELLRQLCASPVGETATRILANIAPAWLAALRREPDATIIDARSPQPKAPGDLCRALEEMAKEKALILVFEDLQWANDSTLELISALARRRTPTKLMLLATYSFHCGPTEHPLKGLKQDLVMHRQCTELALAPLAKTAIRQLLSRELEQEELPPGLDTFIYQHSEGNPLFAIALLRHLISDHFLIRAGANGAGQWEQHARFPDMETGVPQELVQLIDPEIEKLSTTEQRVLEAASLMRVVFPVWAVAAALNQDPAETEETCDKLARRLCFVHRAGHDELPDGTRSDFYAFAHGLYREVLYQKQTASRRAKGHTRIAERLRELFAGREDKVAREVALHYESAGNWKHAATALRTAARHAYQRQEYSEAAQLLQHSLAIAENLNDGERGIIEQEIQAELEMARLAIGTAKQPQNTSAEIDGFWMGT
ncbi:MAG TPA: AAA family ATPase [Acidobacteriaceae bacterium]|nr:AAA family ATPase [Acidobacteriaceae bacterium]